MTEASHSDFSDTSIASHGQWRVWVAEQASPSRSEQIIPLAYSIQGALDVERLERAIASVVDAHESLHTGLVFSGGELFRQPQARPFKLEVLNLSDDDSSKVAGLMVQKIEAFYTRRFDFARDLMLRALLLIESPGKHILHVIVHQSAADCASIMLIQRQISRLYGGETCASVFEVTQPFSDYAMRVRQRESAGEFDELCDDALERLLPNGEPDASNSSEPVHDSRFLRFSIPGHVHAAVDIANAQLGLPPSAIYLAAFDILLCAFYDKQSLLIGLLVENRDRVADTDIVGFITNIVPLNFRSHPDGTLDGCLRDTVTVLASYGRFLDLPYGLLLERLHDGDFFRLDTHPFEALLTYQPQPWSQLMLSGCEVSQSEPACWPAILPIMLDIEEQPDFARVLLRWRSTRFPSHGAAAFSEWYPWIVEQLCSNRNRGLSTVIGELQAGIRVAKKAAADKAKLLREVHVKALIAIGGRDDAEL